MTQIASLVPAAWLAACGLWSANDPFVGTWKLDASRSSIVDQMAVEAAGTNTYTFRFEGGPAETVVADGTDQPAMPGTTLAITITDSHTLKVVRKKAGAIIVSAIWKLSDDNKTLHDAFKGVQPDGSTTSIDYVYARRSGTSGFAGLWESTTRPLGLQYELKIQPYRGEGLSFVAPGSVKSITFDGREHPVAGTTPGLIASGLRRDRASLAYTEKSGANIIDTRTLTLSSDRKTLTIKVEKTDQAAPNLLVLERE